VIRVSSFVEPNAQGPDWRKSHYSMANGNCVEVTSAAGAVLVRDAANPADLILGYSAQAWQAFIAAAKTGSFDASSLVCLVRAYEPPLASSAKAG
jgi:accessory colonization factor AcfC